MAEVPDPRASHYWDDSERLMRDYQQVLGLSEEAWDVYLLYAPDAKWDGELPPKPVYWMHQLGSRPYPRVNGPWFDAGEMSARIRALR